MHIENLGLAISLALGGLGLFLFSIKLLSNGLKQVSGDNLKLILKKSTKTDFHSLLFGLLFTTLIQSSDGAVALIISLVGAGFLKLRKACAFVLGANIGTATTSIIVSMSSNFEFTQYFMILAFIGGMGFLLIKEKSKENVALIVSTLGLLFIGLKVMGAGMQSVASHDAFKDAIGSVGKNQWTSALTSFGLTGIMQSSSATVTIAQGMFQSTTSISLTGATGFVIGANIGTTVTAFLVTIGSNKDTKRIALFWLLTNVTMGILILPIANYYGDFIGTMVDTNPHNIYDSTGKISGMGYNNFFMALSHMFFNMILVLSFFPFIKYIDVLLHKIIKIDEESDLRYDIRLPKDLIYQAPDLAVESANKAFMVIGEMNLDSIRTVEKFLNTTNNKYAERLTRLEAAIVEMRKSLFDYLTLLNRSELTINESSRVIKLVLASRSQERISEILKVSQHDVFKTYSKKKQKLEISKETFNELIETISLLKKSQKLSINQAKKWTSDKNNEIRSIDKQIKKNVEKYIHDYHKRELLNVESKKLDYHKLMNNLERLSKHLYKTSKYFKIKIKKYDKRKTTAAERIEKILSKK